MTDTAYVKKDTLFPTEQLSMRTAFGKTFTVGSGRYKTFQSSIRIHALDQEKAEWTEIDARFMPADGISGLHTELTPPVYASRGPVLTAVCGTGGPEPFLSVKDNQDRSICWGIEDADPVHPEIPEEEKTEGDEPEDPALTVFLTAQRNAQGSVCYAGILPGIDLHCHTDGQMENTFVYCSPESAREIVLLLNAENLEAQTEKDQSIILSDAGGETVFTICPPAVFDNAGEEGPVQLSVRGENGQIRITYAPDPAFMQSAQYPVTLDPVIKTQTATTSIADTFVSSSAPTNNYSTHEQIYVDNDSVRIRHGFIRFTALPALGTNHFITNAQLVLHSTYQPGTTTAVYAREITQSWTPSAVTYNNMPSWNTQTAQDYAKIFADSQYTAVTRFDITALAKKWYKGTNYGVALTGSEPRPSNSGFVSSDSTLSGKPYLQIEYASLAGLEDYLAYDTVPAGRAGTGQVSLVNGNLIFLHPDTVMNGARMPVSVTHVYNSCDADTNAFGCGYGWRTNYHRTLHKEYLDSKVYYVYTDGDGTEHWFKSVNTAGTKYKDESGLSMELVPGSPTTIRDKGDNVMSFPQISTTPTASNPVTGKVLISSIADAQGNTITIAGTGLKINQITDGAGRVTTFAYSGGLLSRIKTPWHTDTSCIAFTYTSSCLTKIQYEDLNTSSVRNSSSYTYYTSGGLTHRLLTRAAGPEGIQADFTYGNTNVASGLPHVVLTAKCWDGSSAVAVNTGYEYGTNLCLVTDQITGNTLRYHFNDNGNCISVDDGLGYAVFAEYNLSGANADAPVNHPTSTSRIQRAVNNLLADGLQCKTSGSAWTKYGTGTVDQSYNGAGFGRYEKKFTVTNGNTLYLRQTVSVTAGKTYTLSGYAQSLGARAFLRVTAGSQTFQSIPVELLGTETQTELERTQVTFKVPSGVSSISCDMVGQGTSRGTVAWWDSAQLEEGETANHVNLVENSKMNRTAGSGLPDCWQTDSVSASFVSYQARSGCAVAMPGHLPGNALHVAGRWDRTVRVYQSIQISGSTGDRLTVGGWCSSYAKKTDTADSCLCRLQVWFGTSNTSDWTGWVYGGTVDFNHEEGNWQFACGAVAAPINYYWVRVAILYNRQMNYADFSNLFLYKEAYGTDYVYDANGNRKRRTEPSGNAGAATYDDYNNILTSAAPGRTVTTNYTWGTTEAAKRKHLLQTVTTPLGTKTSYLYDSYGNPTQVKVQDSTGYLAKFIQTTAAYTTAGTYVATQTDARGKTVTTVTDANKGTVTSVTDPNSQTVNNQYDAIRRLTKTSTMLTSTNEVKSENIYNATTGWLTSVKHNTSTAASGDVAYNFAYDSLGRQTTVSVGSNVLSTTYYNATHRTVDRIAFGNSGEVKYLYDSYSRVSGIRYDGAASNRFSYGYDAQGRTAYVTDHTRGTTVYTDYDLAGRPCRKTHLAGTAHAYTGALNYNAYELPNTFTEYVGTARTRYTTAFSYDNENRVKTLTYDTGSAGYTYDKLGRITKRTLKPASTAVNTTYTYLAGGQGTDSTTGMIQKITQGGVTLTYSYDNCGNITQVSDGTLATKYTYDAIGRLTRVNDQTDTTAGSTGTTWVFTYDLGGNILTKKGYAYTTGSVSGLTPVQSHTYTYGNTNWKDQLTKYDGTAITYDSIGNPTNDGIWSYTWEHGKQLKQMTKSGETVVFEYNEDGLRVKKTATSTGTTEYTVHGKNVVHMTQGSNTLHFYYDGQGKPGIVIFNGTAYGYLYNLQGDVIGLVNASGTKVVEYSYDAWGRQTGRTGTLANTLGKVQPFRYRGYVYDEETGDYYLRSRYYRPGWGRFISADNIMRTIGKFSWYSLFTYCANAPTHFYDPSGHFLEDLLLDIWDQLLYGEKRDFWAMVCLALDCAGMKYSALLLDNANKRKPEKKTFSSCTDLSKKISEDPDFLKRLNDAIDAGTDEFTVRFEQDKDLFGAIHDAKFRIVEMNQHGNGTRYCVKLSDEYDFTDFKTDYLSQGIFSSIAWIGNDLAYLDTQCGALNSYPLVVIIEGDLP